MVSKITTVLALSLGLGLYGQTTVAGQTTAGGQSVSFSLKAKKAPKLSLSPAPTCACMAPSCSLDPLDGSFVIIPGGSITCTVVAVLTPSAPLPAGSAIALASGDPTQITVPPSVTFPACALTPCTATFLMTATP